MPNTLSSYSLPPVTEKRAVFYALSHPFLLFIYYSTIFTIPFFRWRHLSEAYGFLKIDWLLVMALGIIVIPYFVIMKRFPRAVVSNLWPWFALFFIANVFSSAFSPYPAASLNGLRVLVLDFLFIFINLLMIDSQGFRKIMPAVLIASVSLNAFLAILGYFFQVQYFLMGTRGIGGTIGANNAALMGVFVLPLLVHWVIYAKSNTLRIFVVGLLAVNFFGLVSTESRAGFLNMVILFGLIIFQYKHRFHPRYLGLALAMIGIIFLTLALTLPKSYIERQQSLAEGTQADTSTQRRASYLIVAWEAFLESPVLGSGTNTFPEIWEKSQESLRFEGIERGAHNTYMQV